MAQKIFHFPGCTALGVSVTAVLLLTGCVGDMPHRGGAWIASQSNPPVRRANLVPDEYIYYPDYRIYYNRTQQRYVDLENGVWCTWTVPPKIPAQRLLTARSVPMTFHDSPALHHASIVRQYPALNRHQTPRHAKGRATERAVGRSSQAAK